MSVLYLNFENQEIMGKCLIRFQEYVECPKFAGKFFTKQDYASWYVLSEYSKGKFNYYEKVVGYNIPGWAFDIQVIKGFQPLDNYERFLISKIKTIFPGSNHFYVIATAHDARDALEHEMAHAVWFLYEEYRNEAKKILSSSGRIKPVEDYLENRLYNRDTWEDETHAFLGVDYDWLVENGVKVEPYKKVSQKLNKLFREWKNKLNMVEEKITKHHIPTT